VEQAITIEVQQLRAALDVVLTHVEQTVGAAVHLSADYYWALPPDAMYDPYVNPATEALTLGQLSDDVREIRDLLDRDADDGIFVWHDLGHLVGVLQRIAAQDLEDT
jgi:hypothetical protein